MACVRQVGIFPTPLCKYSTELASAWDLRVSEPSAQNCGNNQRMKPQYFAEFDFEMTSL